MTKDNLKEMARSRQQQGLKHYQKAIVSALVAVAIAAFFVIAALSNVAILVALVGCGVAIKFALQGNKAIARSADVETGIAAEKEVASILEVLHRKKWQIEYNLMLSSTWDADVVLRSPRGNWFVIDVKSHGGTKFVSRRGKLKRKYGSKSYGFRGGDPANKVKKQAAIIGQKKNASWVTPVLCFTEGEVEVPEGKYDGVIIVLKDELVKQLLAEDS